MGMPVSISCGSMRRTVSRTTLPLLLKKIGDKAEAVKDLAYCLYDISANKRKDAKEATAYNALIADWTELTRRGSNHPLYPGAGNRQMPLIEGELN